MTSPPGLKFIFEIMPKNWLSSLYYTSRVLLKWSMTLKTKILFP